ncbi:unnamed protein product [Linum trigynum]|uniref:Uncharacterized protein n=1 Tax=Linum trigynum TaxID=586398 RepID=A0AAV2GAL0_9ROSI
MALSIPEKQPSSLYADAFSDDSASFSDIVFGFFEQPAAEDDSPSPNTSSATSTDFPDDDDDVAEDLSYSEERKKFWETQNELLQTILYRTTSVETKIRQDTKDALIEIEKPGSNCTCGKSDGCRTCLRREVAARLQSQGHNCTICKSKWKGNCLGLSGEHSYLEVVENSTKRGEVRVIVELNFRSEFEMARACDEYNHLIARLPEVFVGRVDRLKNLIKTLCSAAEACSKEKKIHLAPWRKYEYMKSKWFGGSCERFVPTAAALPAAYYHRPAKPRASMLTFDLSENKPFPAAMHMTAVKVV